MPGMNPNTYSLSNALIVALFRHALFVTGLFRLTLIAMVLMIALVLSRRILRFNFSAEGTNEPRARTYLRWSFGVIWLVDGILQFQVSMPLGLANNVVAPLRANTPSWLNALMSHGIFLWNSHPINLAVGVAWLQVGIGLILLVSNGMTGRIAGLVSALWAALVWLIGNGAGGIFVSGHRSSSAGRVPRCSTRLRRVAVLEARDLSSVVLARRAARHRRDRGLRALLQLLPSTEFWHGGNTNALTAMTSYMTKIAQPHWLAWLSREVGTIAGSMGGGSTSSWSCGSRPAPQDSGSRRRRVALARVGLGGGLPFLLADLGRYVALWRTLDRFQLPLAPSGAGVVRVAVVA